GAILPRVGRVSRGDAGSGDPQYEIASSGVAPMGTAQSNDAREAQRFDERVGFVGGNARAGANLAVEVEETGGIGAAVQQPLADEGEVIVLDARPFGEEEGGAEAVDEVGVWGLGVGC